ncbi:GTP cyclohydrolase I FolE [Fructobacillus evanidus]|uniref:GTP cyclohydrolase 1 n=1 Tax=Fructobacillus evanidus TaxID=3064281 RepID=A0ABM9MU04_9LACO|nr:GTP cyclohydrolase I (FolE) [Fructobacillus sp. LMG 32999]CAK1238773.1 GTP cyclohydrolase I (FolE) [Fructobacillus sp. LMG 32999]CAK1240017.1 GTP cyclohydrolase I (FolE) [Fructobacillus sp. LMG 32999]CAK1244668.1 GTP cyclohydrolase I (FolE) [Fructobacillus sp. LMG 32999]CAK1244966.1 GTP cyclohydrolase I (FolE) [Fructobacillus sp. LMG 32999]
MDSKNQKIIEDAVRAILTAVGEDVNREGLLETPERVAKMYAEVFGAVNTDFTNFTVFDSTEDDVDQEIITVKKIPFYSMCEHHLLPFFGEVSLAYIPSDGKIVGLSKVPRLIGHVAKKPNVQERLTSEVAQKLDELIHPKGIAIVVRARHMCMEMRGVRSVGNITETTYYMGEFKGDLAKQSLFLQQA